MPSAYLEWRETAEVAAAAAAAAEVVAAAAAAGGGARPLSLEPSRKQPSKGEKLSSY